MDAECTVDGCDYTGPLPSVEAHISASTTNGHKGMLGTNYRRELREQVEGHSRDDDPEPTGDDTNDEATESEGDDPADSAGNEDGEESQRVGGVARSEGRDTPDRNFDTTEPAVGSGQMVLIATVAFAVIVLFVATGNGDDDPDDDPAESDQEESAQEPAQPEVSLIE